MTYHPQILPLLGKTPSLGKDCWLAPGAYIIGDVEAGNQCTFWFNSILRGDVNSISLGNKVNIQDGAILHGTFKKHATKLGSHVSVGHRALVHGCTVHDYVLIGMGAIVMDRCVVEPYSIVAAGAVLLEGTHVPSGTIFAGVPARKVKELSPDQVKTLIEGISNNYVEYASWYQS